MTESVRMERDTFGEIAVPADRLWGAQTQRSLQNFRISTEKQSPELIRALATVKRAAATVNAALGQLAEDKARAIEQAADEVLAGKHDGEFPLAVWQTGSGTQTNMNLNEVLANTRVYTPRDFGVAIQMLQSGRVDVDRLLSVAPPSEAPRHFANLLAGRTDAIKMLFKFDD